MTGLELIRWLHMVTNAYAGAADEQFRDTGHYRGRVGSCCFGCWPKTLRLRRRHFADAPQPAPERQQEHDQRAASAVLRSRA